MRKLIGRVALLLVLTLALLPLQPFKPEPMAKANTTTQVRLVDPSGKARVENVKKINKLIDQYNAHVSKFRQAFCEKQATEIDADKAAEAIAEMGLLLNDIHSKLVHIDEVDP